MTIGSTLSNLIREGVVVLYHDYRNGTCLDRGSLRLNNGVPSAGCKWSGRALTFFPTLTQNVAIAHHASQQLVTGSAVVLARWDKQPAAMVFLRKLAGVGDCNIYWIGNATQLYTYDGVNTRTLNVDVKGARSIGITYAVGATPIGYKDGIVVGNYSGTVTFNPSVQPLYIGGTGGLDSIQSPLEAVVWCNRVLTATEMAAVHSDLINARWPSRYVSLAKRVQGSVIGEPTLKAGYTLKPVGASVPSHNGAFVGTVSGQASYRESILGPALELGRVTGAVDLGLGNATINPTTDSHWVEVWARPLDVAMSDAAVPIIGKGLNAAVATYRNFGIQHTNLAASLCWRTAADAAVSVAGPVPYNALTHYLYQVDRVGNNAYLYVNGVAYGPTAITTVYAVAATNWLVGKNGSSDATFDESFGGLVCNPRIGLGVLTAAQVQARYLEGARAIQFKTGFGYQISPVAEGGVLGQQIGGTSSPFRAGDTTGRWKIETDTIEGKTCKAMVCSTAGKLYVPASYFGDSTPTENAFGTFDLYARKADASVFDMNLIATVNTGITTGYGVKWAADESVVLYEYGVGNVIAGGSASHSVWHRFRVTRSITGLFTAYVDGVSFGTGTDITTLTSVCMVLDMDAGDKIALGNSLGGSGLAKFLGVVTPSEG